MPIARPADQTESGEPAAGPVHPRKAAIVATARSLLFESGIQGVRTSAIARRAGMSEGGLYRHFGSLTDLLLAVVDSIFEDIFVLFAAPDGISPMAHLRLIADRHSALMADDTRSFARPWLEIIATAPRLGLRQRAVEKQLAAGAALAEIAAAGQRAGEIRPEIEPEHLAWEFLSWAWGENVSSTIGLTDFIQRGHSARMIHRILDEAAAPAPGNGPAEGTGRMAGRSRPSEGGGQEPSRPVRSAARP